ncbi:MAG: hypothetical protein AB7E46_07555 [Desulfovibrio sp.]
MVLMVIRAIIYALIFLSSFSVSEKAVVISVLFYFNAYCVAQDSIFQTVSEKMNFDLAVYFTWLSNKFDNPECSLVETIRSECKSKEVKNAMSPNFEETLVYTSIAAEIAVIAVAYGVYRVVLSSNIFNIINLLHGI